MKKINLILITILVILCFLVVGYIAYDYFSHPLKITITDVPAQVLVGG